VKPFRIAIVGAGVISRAHIAAAKATHGAVVVTAVIDPDERARRAAADAANAKPFASFDEFLAAPDSSGADWDLGVIVCTPPSVRIPIIEPALRHGLHVLVEKPLAHTVADAHELNIIAARYNRRSSFVGYCHRFTPAVVEMRRRIRAGEIGTVTRFENTFAGPLPQMRDHWMSDRVVSGGGSFLDTGSHSLDLFNFLAGGGYPEAAVFYYAWPGRGESSATVLLRGEEGVAGVIQSSWTEPARFIVTVVGTGGALSYDYDRPTELRLRLNDGRDEVIPVESHEVRFQRQLEAFALAAGGRGSAVQPATFIAGRNVAETAEAVQKLAQPSP
jgi:predicted dehydrogenase